MPKKETTADSTELKLPVVTDDTVKRADYKYLPIKSLKLYDRNPRMHTPTDIKLVALSIAHFGWTNPVQIQKGTNVVIGGHGRIAAAEMLGLTKVPIAELDHDDQDADAYRFADNRLAELSFWDKTMVREGLSELDANGFPIGLTGFTDEFLKNLIDKGGSGPMGDGGVAYKTKYEVVVECTDGEDQKNVFDMLTEKGYTCRVLTL